MFAAQAWMPKPSIRTLLLVSALCAAACHVSIAAEQRAAPPASPANSLEKPADTKSAATKDAATSLCDANCAKRATEAAGQACAPLIEAKAPIDYDWLARPFGGIFLQAERSPESSVVRYQGDAIRFLTQQNQWIRVSYECGYDVAVAKIVFVNVRPGRLDRPAIASAEQTNDQKQPANAQRPAPQPSQLSGQQAPNQTGSLPAVQSPSNSVNNAKIPTRYGEPSAIDISQLPARR